MTDEIRRLTEILARDPGNAAFRDLAELLRKRGELEVAHRVAIRGLERHSLDAEAHALLARICADRGELQRAFDEWDMALRLAPKHAGALKGLGFISYRWGRLQDAERYLLAALQLVPDDATVQTALASVRHAMRSLSEFPGAPSGGTAGTNPSTGASDEGMPAPSSVAVDVVAQASVARLTPAPVAAVTPVREPERVRATSPAELFADLDMDAGLQGLLVDRDGLIVAGSFLVADGADRGAEIGAELSAVGEEANRAMRHLGLGDWTSLSFESLSGSVAVCPERDDSLVVVASDRSTPLGLLRRALNRARRNSSLWLETQK
jgi:predicted regulator of Ras-like GTPase activity (Roadblock/LC7/MglB family)